MDKKPHKVRGRREQHHMGSITVEMSMIFPIVMYVIFSIIYAGMYLRDYVVIHQVIDEIVLESNTAAKYPMESNGEHIDYSHINDRGVFFVIDSDYSIENNTYSEHLLDSLKNSLLITKIEQPNVNITNTKITASIICTVKIPFKSVRILLGENRLNYSQKSETEVFHPTEFVRKFTALSKLVEGTKIGDEGIKKLRDIIKGH
jgi:hypothetical protein